MREPFKCGIHPGLNLPALLRPGCTTFNISDFPAMGEHDPWWAASVVIGPATGKLRFRRVFVWVNRLLKGTYGVTWETHVRWQRPDRHVVYHVVFFFYWRQKYWFLIYIRHILVGGFKHLFFSISYMGCHPSHWRTPSFSRWLLHHQPV